MNRYMPYICRHKLIVMKRILLFVLISFLVGHYAEAQKKDIKQPSFGFQFSFIDFPTANDLRTGTLSSVIDAKQWSETIRMDPGFTLL